MPLISSSCLEEEQWSLHTALSSPLVTSFSLQLFCIFSVQQNSCAKVEKYSVWGISCLHWHCLCKITWHHMTKLSCRLSCFLWSKQVVTSDIHTLPPSWSKLQLHCGYGMNLGHEGGGKKEGNNATHPSSDDLKRSRGQLHPSLSSSLFNSCSLHFSVLLLHRKPHVQKYKKCWMEKFYSHWCCLW